MKINFFIIYILFFVACNKNNINDFISKSNEYRINKDYSNAIIVLKNAIKNNLNDVKDLDKIYFMLGEIYLNDLKDFDFAIKEFKKINEKSSLYAKSIFMIGYIYSNNLNEYSQAINYYNIFIENFSKHELYPSVEYELNQLQNYEQIIDSLNVIANSKIKGA